ncbi:MAG TPA: phosphoglucosamine mutase, partial [Coriobacteriia bacterium]|nr:phosphoglucosamine mutase [Coriobacteriia bacterium]
LFGTDGVRGVANTELTPELAFRLGEAAGHFLGERGQGRIVVGRDTRRSGGMLEAAIVAGICSGGADALVAGIVPTPAVAHLTREFDADGGVVISASHNPAPYNGIKFFSRDGFKLPDELEDEIEAFTAAKREWERPTGADVGRVVPVGDALDRYVRYAAGTIDDDLSGLTIAVDCGHGAASVATPRTLRQLGAKVISVNCDWDGMDINDACGSTDLGPLIELVRTHEVDFGIAHDGDADRVLAVDETGSEIDGDMIMAVCATQMKARNALKADTVVSTVMCNLGFEIAMRDHGIAVIKTKVGDRYVLEQMLASGAVLGGEQSGHVIFLDHSTTGDGLITALQVADIVKRSGRPLSELRSVMTRYPQVLVNVSVREKGMLGASAAISDAVHAAEDELGDHGRVLVRASGTEPLVRVMAEAADERVARAVVDRLARVVEAELA